IQSIKYIPYIHYKACSHQHYSKMELVTRLLTSNALIDLKNKNLVDLFAAIASNPRSSVRLPHLVTANMWHSTWDWRTYGLSSQRSFFSISQALSTQKSHTTYTTIHRYYISQFTSIAHITIKITITTHKNHLSNNHRYSKHTQIFDQNEILDWTMFIA
ncbi:hypothetical protein ACJX0J_033136, partial [Zea mays]